MFSAGHPKTILHKYQYVITVDSASVLSEPSMNQIDSLVTTIKHHEQQIAEHYDYILQQREDSQNWLTFGGIILSVVVSVFGFFGFKNFKSIEEKATDLAEMTAEKTAKKTAEMIAMESMEEATKRISDGNEKRIHQTIRKMFEKYKNKTLDNVIDCKLQEAYNSNVETELSKITDLQERLVSIEEDLQSLRIKLDVEETKDQRHNTAFSNKGESSKSDDDANLSLIDRINNYNNEPKEE